jgi:hypothetical protein
MVEPAGGGPGAGSGSGGRRLANGSAHWLPAAAVGAAATLASPGVGTCAGTFGITVVATDAQPADADKDRADKDRANTVADKADARFLIGSP